MKNWVKWSLLIVGILALLSMIVGAFDGVAAPVAKILNQPVEVVKSWARTIAAVAIAIVLIIAAISTIAAAPVLGVILLAVGIGTAVLTLWPVFSSGE